MMLALMSEAAPARTISTNILSWFATVPSMEFSGIFGTTRCALTIEGQYHFNQIAKTAGSLVGYFTRALETAACAAGALTVLQETLPWHMQYAGFAGTLPSITALRENVVGMAFRVRETGGITCLARSTTAEPATMTFNREAFGNLTSVSFGGRIRTGAECFGAAGEVRGSSNRLTSFGGIILRLTLI
jgi:hypothetical protein